jgi:hypothetical protein
MDRIISFYNIITFLVGVLQAFLDNVFDLLANLLIWLVRWENNILGSQHNAFFLYALLAHPVSKRPLPKQHLEKHDPNRPDIDLFFLVA